MGGGQLELVSTSFERPTRGQKKTMDHPVFNGGLLQILCLSWLAIFAQFRDLGQK